MTPSDKLHRCVRCHRQRLFWKWLTKLEQGSETGSAPMTFRQSRKLAKVVGNNYGFACKDIGIDIGWDRLSLDNTCPKIVLRPAIPFGPDSSTMVSSSLKWNDV